MPEHTRDPIEILCKEIGFDFDRRLETIGMLVGFVSVLVYHVAGVRWQQQQLAELTGKLPSVQSEEVFQHVSDLLSLEDRGALIAKAAEIHSLIHRIAPDDAHPCDHLVDMLSSCVSAIRFGLEEPCHSRHAAAAAGHIWSKIYGIKLFDRFTPAWEREWTRAQLQAAIVARATR